MNDFQKLRVWQIAMPFSLAVYQVTSNFPSEEKFGITSQLRRAAISIISNIAEGAGRGSDKDKVRFLEFAISSSYEVEAQLIFSKELGYLSEDQLPELMETLKPLQRSLAKLIQYLKSGKKTS